MLLFRKGDIFTSSAQILVNPVNCVGVMGKGLALQFKERFPEMFEEYKWICDRKLLKPGLLWIWKDKVLCFPTKDNWKDPSLFEIIIPGLEKFRATYKEKGITSIAFPLLGAGCGGLRRNEVIEMMNAFLGDLDIPIEIWEK